MDSHTMNIKATDGTEIDVTPYLEQMRENHRLDRNVLEQTSIGTTADNGYFWWDEETNPALTKRSVNKLIKSITAK